MRFECGDLDRALANSDLMPEAREHLKLCAACRREYRLWTEISSAARELHHDWESPAVWPAIQRALEAEPKQLPPWWKRRTVWSLAAAVLMAAVLTPFLLQRNAPKPPSGVPDKLVQSSQANSDFLTEQALADVEKNEATYRRSIQKLSELAAPKLARTPSAAALNAKEKLLMLDSAIAETRTNVASNRFNVRLQMTLADLYREKQQTLQELLSHDHNQKN